MIFVSVSVCITASLLKEHLCSVRLVTLVLIGVATRHPYASPNY